MESCPVCTLYLRDGISLYDHLDTHPKEQVIDALVRSVREERLQEMVNTPTTQSQHFQASQNYSMPQYTGNTFFSQIVPTSGLPPQAAPVTMLLPPTSSANMLQMIYNPFIMQPPPQSPLTNRSVQIANSASPSGQVQQTTIHRTICSSSNLNVDSQLITQSCDTIPGQINIPVSESIIKSTTQTFSNQNLKGVITPLPILNNNPNILSSKNKLIDSSLVFASPSFTTVPISTTSENTTLSPIKHVKCPTPTYRNNSHSKMRIVHIIPNNSHKKPTFIPHKQDVRDVQSSNSISELRDLNKLIANNTIELTPITPEVQQLSVETSRTIESIPSFTRLSSLIIKNETQESSSDRSSRITRVRSPSSSANGIQQFKEKAPSNLQDPNKISNVKDKEYYDNQPCTSRNHERIDEPIIKESQLNYSEDNQYYPCAFSLPRKLVSPDIYLRKCCEENLEQLSSLQTTDLPQSPKKSGAQSPALSHVSRESKSPGLRIRTDLNKNRLKSYPDGILHNIFEDSNDSSELVGIVRNSLKIQLPPSPVRATDCDEYITSDCNYTNIKDVEVYSQQGTSNNCKETTTFESKDPDDIVNVNGVHIVVPQQFYNKTDKNEKEEDKSEIEHSTQADATDSLQCEEEIVETEQKKAEILDDNINVSTSYDLLARESWVASDCSDTEVNADCNVVTSAPHWESDVVESRPTTDRRYGKSKATRVYKCGICKQVFNCPKERRVHRSTHTKDVTSEMDASTGVTISSLVVNNIEESLPVKKKKLVVKKKKLQKDKCRILIVKNEEAKFMGVFVKEDNVTQVEDENVEVKLSLSSPGGSDIKNESVVTLSSAPTSRSNEEMQFKCLKCSRVFDTKRQLILHIVQDHSTAIGGNHMCDVCQEIFGSELLYNDHLKIHPLECKTCWKPFYRAQNLTLHMKRHLGIKPHKCQYCGKTFITKQKLSEHINVHTGASPIKCPLCTMTFRRYSNLIQHKNRFHYKIKKKVKDYVCFCGEIFHSKKKLEWHKEIHEKKPKCCSFCSERFVHSASLTRHIRRAHDVRYMPKPGREFDNVECTICKHVFLKNSLAIHMRVHSGERPFGCAVCGKNFTTKWNLQQHRWTHSSRSNKPFKCTLCNGAFARESDFQNHMDSHRNKRQYTCNICGEQFARKNNCQRHVKEHETVKSFTCQECGKQFHRGYYLKDHLKIHNGLRPFTCHICGKASSTKSNHNKHVKIHHAREPVNTES